MNTVNMGSADTGYTRYMHPTFWPRSTRGGYNTDLDSSAGLNSVQLCIDYAVEMKLIK